jgi:hypothetical protein
MASGTASERFIRDSEAGIYGVVDEPRVVIEAALGEPPQPQWSVNWGVRFKR